MAYVSMHTARCSVHAKVPRPLPGARRCSRAKDEEPYLETARVEVVRAEEGLQGVLLG